MSITRPVLRDRSGSPVTVSFPLLTSGLLS
jgi:hypothetical protein